MRVDLAVAFVTTAVTLARQGLREVDDLLPRRLGCEIAYGLRGRVSQGRRSTLGAQEKGRGVTQKVTQRPIKCR